MKKLFTICLIVLVSKNWAQCAWTYSVFNYSGGYSLTCSNPSLNLTAVHNNSNNTVYQWTGPSLNATTSAAAVLSPGVFTVTLTDAVTSCSMQQVFTVGINVVAPTNTVTPASQAVICNGASISFTGTSTLPAPNVLHEWYTISNPYPAGAPIASSNTTMSILNGNLPSGVYTLQTTDLSNGCKAYKTVTITSISAFPTFGLYSPTYYSVGCVPLNQTTIAIINPVSQSTPAATCSFTFLPPGFVGVVPPNVPLSNNSFTSTTLPGTWTVIIQDDNSFCRSQIFVPVYQNTVAPNIAASMVTQTLTCFTPTIYAVGTSSTLNTTIEWNVPSTPSVISTPTVALGPVNGPNTSTTSLSYASYTVVVTNSMNACQSNSMVTINQNFKPPVSSPTISGLPGAICNSNTVVLSTGSSTTTSGGPLATIIAQLWEGPAPQATATGVSNYNCMVAGNYSLTVKDSYNGCTKMGTVIVASGVPSFSLLGFAATSSVGCDGNIIIIPQSIPGFSVSASSGTVTPNPPQSTSIQNLCAGKVVVCLTGTNSGCKKCDSLDIGISNGIKQFNMDDEFILYPNPTNSTFYIKNTSQKSGNVKVFNVEGKEIENLILESSSTTEIKNLNAGIYFVEVKVEGIILRKKLIVISR